MKELRTDQFIEKHKTTPKIGYTLFDYVQINDSTFDYLCQMRFGDKSLYEYKGIVHNVVDLNQTITFQCVPTQIT